MQGQMCDGYVKAFGIRVTCQCKLPPHGDDVPHECYEEICGGSWFGADGQVSKSVRLPLSGNEGVG